MIESNSFLSKEDVEEVNKLLIYINMFVGSNFVDAFNNNDDESLIDTFVDGNTYDAYNDMDCVLSWLDGIKLMTERKKSKCLPEVNGT